jgi:hypothetical protein
MGGQHRRARGRSKEVKVHGNHKEASPSLSVGEKNRMASGTFAFPKERKVPLNDASHVRNAVARFDQVKDVTESERDAAWRRIRDAA